MRNLNSSINKKNRTSASNKFKVGIYIRVSTEEQAENPEGSIKNQEQRLRDYVKMRNTDGPWGDIVEIFNDPGISAKDMNRPALKRMLAMVHREEINLVLVTEISRLTRSIKDFVNLWDFMKDHDCKFQSLRDNFDTTTPAGEMILFTLANFAQFERKQLGERIANAFQARAKRGLWNGGVLPLGYDLDPAKPGHLIVVESEAEIVREVFETFLKEETLSKTGRSLNDRKIKLPMRPRNGGIFRHVHFTISPLYRMLTNRAYIGRRVYQTKEGVKEVAATWEPLVDEVKFQRIQKMLASNKSARKPSTPTRFPYILTGLVVCETCGDRLCGKSAHGNAGKIAYYEHAWKLKNQNCLSKRTFNCNPQRVLAKKIEPVVWQDMKRLLLGKEYSQEIMAEAAKIAGQMSSKTNLDKLEAKITGFDRQIEAITERLSELPKEINAQPFYDQIMKLQASKESVEKELETAKITEYEKDEALSFSDYKSFIDSLKELLRVKGEDPEVQAAICRKFIHKIEVSPKGITIQYHVGQTHFRALMEANKKSLVSIEDVQKNKKGSADKKSGGPFFVSKPLEKYKNLKGLVESGEENWRQAVRCSNSLTFGRECRIRTDDIHLVRVALYQLS